MTISFIDEDGKEKIISIKNIDELITASISHVAEKIDLSIQFSSEDISKMKKFIEVCELCFKR